MDLHMPGMGEYRSSIFIQHPHYVNCCCVTRTDGVTAAKKIREEVRDHQVPYIIACTANLQDGVRSICFNAGINAFVSKPIRVRKLEQALKLAKQTVIRHREKLLALAVRKSTL